MTLTVSAEPQAGQAPPGGRSAPLTPARSFEGHSVRSTVIDGQPWLSASDLCRALQLPIGGKVTPAKYTRGLLAADRSSAPFLTPQGTQRLSVLSLSGALTLASIRRRRIDGKVRTWLRREFPDA